MDDTFYLMELNGCAHLVNMFTFIVKYINSFLDLININVDGI